MEQVLNKLKEYNQEHLLMFFNELTQEKKEEILKQIANIDFEQIKNIVNDKCEKQKEMDIIEPITSVQNANFTESELSEFSNIGREIISSSKYAIITMAGGQGTRLGHTGPKGTYKLSFKDKDRYIFEIFVDKLKAVYDAYGVYLPWYIMTSRSNNDETISFFENNNYFGYPKDKIKFFAQGELPITDMEGNVVLESQEKVFMAADGNGGIFNALVKNNIIAELKETGIEWVLITGVDNILANMADETYIGLVKSQNKLNGVKSIVKSCPEEKVGVFCRRNKRPSVIEYTEMTDVMRHATDNNGNYLYADANIVNHLLNIQMLERIGNNKLPIHKAIKRLDYIDKNGEYIRPNEPSVIKYETFIFDYFSMVDDTTVYRVERDKEFAPIKNKEGVDSPVTAIKLYENFYFKEG